MTRLAPGGAVAALLAAACTSMVADQRTFDGTRWQVTAINGHSTPRTESYRIAFTRSMISGHVGCNRFTAEYRARGDVMTTTGLGGTEMACAEPGMTFESWGYSVLGAPMRIHWTSDRRLTLAGERGSIALERIG